MCISAQDKLRKICNNLQYSAQTYWYYKLIGSVTIEETTDNNIQTIAFRCFEQGEKRLQFNKDYITNIEDDNYLKCLILHELLHYISGHIVRGNGKDCKIWQIATDIVVNRELKTNIDKELSDKFKTPQDYGLQDTDNNGTLYSAEDYYELLQNERDLKQDDSDSNKKDNDSKNIKENTKSEDTIDYNSNETSNSEKDNISTNNQKQNNNIDYHGYWEKDSKNTNIIHTKTTFENIYAQLTDYQREAVPDQVKTYYIKSEQNAKVDWKKIIKANIQKSIKNKKRNSYLRPSRRFGIGFKGKVSNRIAKIILAIDCSKSIEKEQIDSFSKEIIYICKQYPVELRVIQCNYKILNDKKYKNKQAFIDENEIEVEGGTSYAPVFDRIESEKYKPNILIYFTDLVWLTKEEKKQKGWKDEECIESFPQYIPKYKTIWACCKCSNKFKEIQERGINKIPFGYVIDID